jgi:hypothetical protein
MLAGDMLACDELEPPCPAAGAEATTRLKTRIERRRIIFSFDNNPFDYKTISPKLSIT